MKKNKSDVEAFLQFFTAATSLTLMLVLFLSTYVEKVECLGSYLEEASCLSGGTGNASACSPGADDEIEYLMDEIEISRRILAGGKTITYDGLQKAPYCNAQVYANCIGPDGKFYKKRDCGYKEQCRK